MEEQLIKRLKANDERAFDTLYEKYKNLVFFVIVGIVTNRDTAEELLQDTFCKMYRNINQYQDGNFKAWLLKIAKNLALNYVRQEKQVLELNEEAVYDAIALNPDSDDIFYDLRKVLSHEEFTVLVLSAVYDIRHKDIAKFLDKPTSTISWLYQVAKKKAKNMLEGR